MLYTMQLAICALFSRIFSKYIMIQDFYPLHNHVSSLHLQCATKGFIKCIVSDFQLNYGQNICLLITLFKSRYFFFQLIASLSSQAKLVDVVIQEKSWLRAVDKYMQSSSLNFILLYAVQRSEEFFLRCLHECRLPKLTRSAGSAAGQDIMWAPVSAP